MSFQIIAGDGKTKQFSRSGAFVNQFPSLLPGGNRSNGNRGEVTILDTVFSTITRTFYVIDCMVWNQLSYYDCDTEFRFMFTPPFIFNVILYISI
jgi:snurportin-1